jgi:hypothetical protein
MPLRTRLIGRIYAAVGISPESLSKLVLESPIPFSNTISGMVMPASGPSPTSVVWVTWTCFAANRNEFSLIKRDGAKRFRRELAYA